MSKEQEIREKLERYNRESKPYYDELNKLLALRAPSGMINGHGEFKMIYPPPTEVEIKLQKCIEEIWRNIYAPNLGTCKRCKQEPAVTDYNGHNHFVCAHCNRMLEAEFEDEYR